MLYAELEREPEPREEPLLRTFVTTLGVSFDNVAMYGQLLDHAYNDQLLQLPNRNRFIELLEQRLKEPEGLALALVDIDDFSDINDAFGHRFGDQVLQVVAARMSEQLGSKHRDRAHQCRHLRPAGRCRADQQRAHRESLFEEPFTVAGERLQLSATTGLVKLTESAALGSELLLDAHIALKRAKQQHRGAAQYFNVEMGVDARERFKLLKGLRASFEARRLFVVYQPQMDLMANRVIGAEALLRWRNEDGKFVPPDQFIPLAEQSGLIISIGEFVLRTACHQAKRLRDMGFDEFRVAVNISLAQFRHAQFIPTLQAAMRDAEVPGDALELEITESMAMEDVDMVLHVLSDIRATGASVAIDDFGTGFSSLSQLRQLQVERLKIDRAFVQEAQSSSAGGSIAAMVVNLGRTLGMRVLAEGIETEEQADPAAPPRLPRRPGLSVRAADAGRSARGLAGAAARGLQARALNLPRKGLSRVLAAVGGTSRATHGPSGPAHSAQLRHQREGECGQQSAHQGNANAGDPGQRQRPAECQHIGGQRAGQPQAQGGGAELPCHSGHQEREQHQSEQADGHARRLQRCAPPHNFTGHPAAGPANGRCAHQAKQRELDQRRHRQDHRDHQQRANPQQHAHFGPCAWPALPAPRGSPARARAAH